MQQIKALTNKIIHPVEGNKLQIQSVTNPAILVIIK